MQLWVLASVVIEHSLYLGWRFSDGKGKSDFSLRGRISLFLLFAFPFYRIILLS